MAAPRAETNPTVTTWSCEHQPKQKRQTIWNPSMNVQTQSQVEPIDHKTSRSICDAVGERLQEQFRPDDGNLSIRLRQLLEELRRRDA
jgi:hypothetical protein